MDDEDEGKINLITNSDGNSKQETPSIQQLAEGFAQLHSVDPAAQVKAIESVVDNLLARLEEICSVTDQIRTESKEVLFVTLPGLFQEANKLREIFQQIDNLERFINLVKNYVNEMDEQVQIAEKEFGNKQVKKIWSSIPNFLMRKQTFPVESSTHDRPDSWKRPQHLPVNDYFVESKKKPENWAGAADSD